ncbi:hypothetical protein BJ508DRAFT_418767 [Ascobolus immersus RN42]|uniref:Uncharacterized protein n=1 Tax=Ascobolus immersus RN42 TaxID=1160509 RepID=A0A3N4HWR6_ASCIM|nr:hypothetical protein BJ508DRAFT_418767 [Ascobolus immersus RN42]
MALSQTSIYAFVAIILFIGFFLAMRGVYARKEQERNEAARKRILEQQSAQPIQQGPEGVGRGDEGGDDIDRPTPYGQHRGDTVIQPSQPKPAYVEPGRGEADLEMGLGGSGNGTADVPPPAYSPPPYTPPASTPQQQQRPNWPVTSQSPRVHYGPHSGQAQVYTPPVARNELIQEDRVGWFAWPWRLNGSRRNEEVIR